MNHIDYNVALLGKEGFEILQNLRILIVGLGGLGSFVAQELVRIGAQNLVLVDNDRVDRSNLNRQILYDQSDVGKSKALVAAKKLKNIAPWANIEAFDTRLTKTNGGFLVNVADIVIDCTDNFETKKLLNRLCYAAGRGFITAGVGSWEGWVASFPFFKREDKELPCLECLFPGELEALKELASGPTAVTTVAVVGSLQVQEVVNMVSGKGESLEGKTLVVDLRGYQCFPVKINKNPQCEVCSPFPAAVPSPKGGKVAPPTGGTAVEGQSSPEEEGETPLPEPIGETAPSPPEENTPLPPDGELPEGETPEGGSP